LGFGSGLGIGTGSAFGGSGTGCGSGSGWGSGCGAGGCTMAGAGSGWTSGATIVTLIGCDALGTSLTCWNDIYRIPAITAPCKATDNNMETGVRLGNGIVSVVITVAAIE